MNNHIIGIRKQKVTKYSKTTLEDNLSVLGGFVALIGLCFLVWGLTFLIR